MDTETSQAFAKVLEYIVNSLGGVVEDKGSDVVEYIKTLGSEIVAYKLGIAYMWERVAIIAAIAGIILIIVGLVKKIRMCSMDWWYMHWSSSYNSNYKWV